VIRVGGWEIGSGIVKDFLGRLGRNRLLGPQNDGLAKAGSNEAKSVSWHSDPKAVFNRNGQRYACCRGGGGRSCRPRGYFMRA